MKTIGILGGLGPQATMDFEHRLHQAAQRLIPPSGNSGYPPLVVYYHRRPPFVMQDGYMPALPLQADPDLLHAGRWLGGMADFMVITSNGAHMVQSQIEEAAGCKVLSMIDVTLAEAQRRAWRKIGVLGFANHQVPVYTQPLAQLNLAYETIEPGLQTRLNTAVQALTAGRETSEGQAVIRDAVSTLRARAVDGIILGCTELPLLLGEDADAPDLLNPAHLLAEVAVRHALA